MLINNRRLLNIERLTLGISQLIASIPNIPFLAVLRRCSKKLIFELLYGGDENLTVTPPTVELRFPLFGLIDHFGFIQSQRKFALNHSSTQSPHYRSQDAFAKPTIRWLVWHHHPQIQPDAIHRAP